MNTVEAGPARGAFQESYSDLRSSRGGGEPAWLAAARDDAMAVFTEKGFPTRQDEEWRYTNVQAVTSPRYVRAPSADVAGAALESLTFPARARVVLVNGRPVLNLSRLHDLPEGVSVRALADALRTPDRDGLRETLTGPHPAGNAFSALNTAFFEDGVVLRADATAEEPLHLLHLAAGAGVPFAAHPRIVIHVARGAQLTLVEHHVSLGGEFLVNAVTDVVLEDGAVLRHVKIGDEGRDGFHVAMTRVRAARDARYAGVFCNYGAALARNDVHVSLAGEGAECSVDGLYHLGGSQHCDMHTTIDHLVPHCTSSELFKGIVDEKARGVFFGRIIVRPDAQKTRAEQTNNNLLLSDDALVDTTPQLEIYADDVQCRHGSTIGQIQPEHLFYLRSRGIGAAEARRLLTYAFANEVIDRIPVAAVRERLTARLAVVEEPVSGGPT